MIFSSVDVSPLDGHEPGEGVDGLEYEVRGSFRIVQEGVKPNSEKGDFRGQVFEVIGVFENLKLFGSEVLRVEAVLASVLVAGLAAALAFGLDVAMALEVVEGALGGSLSPGMLSRKSRISLFNSFMGRG